MGVSGLHSGSPMASAMPGVNFSIMKASIFSLFFLCLAKLSVESSFGSLGFGMSNLPSFAPGP
ncbi:hypothetical protein D3C83_279030 [compost metagenome]